MCLSPMWTSFVVLMTAFAYVLTCVLSQCGISSCESTERVAAALFKASAALCTAVWVTRRCWSRKGPVGKSCFMMWGLVMIVRPHKCSSDIKSVKEDCVWLEMMARLCFLSQPEEKNVAKHMRFMSRHSRLFKRMHKGVHLMIYYLLTPWKSKWILESAQLLNPDLVEGDLWKRHGGALRVPLCVLASMCETPCRPH